MFLLIFSLVCIVFLSLILSSKVKIGGVHMGSRSVMKKERPPNKIISHTFP